MPQQPVLLDLFCGAGGCAVGYHRAGFDVVGVDHESQPRYPFEFIKADAMLFLKSMMEDHPEDNGGMSIKDFAAIHASPPCQGYSRMRHLPWLKGRTYPLLIDVVRAGCMETGLPWVIENVDGAPLVGILLCGTMFGLKTFRHRLFESSIMLFEPPHEKHPITIGVNGSNRFNDKKEPKDGWVSLAGKGTRRMTDAARAAFDVPWMQTSSEVSQAIPPAYTEYIGKQLIRCIGVAT